MGWIGYRLFFFAPFLVFFTIHVHLIQGFMTERKKRDVGHAFGSVSVFCFLFYYTTGGCLASYIFCSFFFDSPIPPSFLFPLLDPLLPLTYLWCP